MFKAAAINLTVWIEKKNRDSLWVKKRRKMVAEEESSKYTQQKRKKPEAGRDAEEGERSKTVIIRGWRFVLTFSNAALKPSV